MADEVDGFFGARELDGGDKRLAAVACALAGQLVACEQGTAHGLSAAPPITRRLVEVLEVFPARDAAEAERKAELAEKAERLAERQRRQSQWANGQR